MKSIGLFAIAILTLASCKKESTNDCSLVPAQIIRYDCDRVIFQLPASTGIGDSSWTDVQTGETYTNVASYYNTCEIASITKGELQTLYVKLQPATVNQIPADCFQCLGIPQNPPQKKVLFTEISSTPCDGGLAICH